jgi:hypothetical protein
METMALEVISTASSYYNVLNLILKFDHGTIVADFGVARAHALRGFNEQVSQCDQILGRRS